MSPPYSRRSVLALGGAVGLSALAGCSDLVGSDTKPLRVINASDSPLTVDIAIDGWGTVDRTLSLSAHSQTVLADAFASPDDTYPFTIEVTVNGDVVLSEEHDYANPDEYVLYLMSPSTADFTKAPVDK